MTKVGSHPCVHSLCSGSTISDNLSTGFLLYFFLAMVVKPILHVHKEMCGCSQILSALHSVDVGAHGTGNTAVRQVFYCADLYGRLLTFTENAQEGPQLRKNVLGYRGLGSEGKKKKKNIGRFCLQGFWLVIEVVYHCSTPAKR